MSGSKYVDSEDFLYTGPIREQGNIYKPNNKVMADELSEKEFQDVHTKEIDLVNRDPKHLNDEVVKDPVSRPLVSYRQPPHPAWCGPAKLITWGRGYAAIEDPQTKQAV
ncbi:caveolin-1 isoform X3 [Ahaetulla prasina]|uniref:caveolin-1 isoform X3 n=1 Tax=Ahaetulla prasina TaxID=499056 RepID=UPI00264920C0|nr:caveolin-1 isoform X3 [Ahaetulla prasina]